jgi:peptidyl-prolyl cis-trans isomerase B (cyclophilin B)
LVHASSQTRRLFPGRLPLLAIGLLMITIFLTGATARAERSNPVVKIETSMGEIEVELYEDKAPKSVANFLAYVKEGHYDGTIFHRVINGFMIQGGGFTPDMKQKPTKNPVENEADNGLKNEAYTLAMARTQDPHSATAQFFINVKNNDFLNHTSKTPQGWGYTVFGKVVKGQGVVNKIKGVPTGSKGMFDDVPKDDVTIVKAEVVEP